VRAAVANFILAAYLFVEDQRMDKRAAMALLISVLIGGPPAAHAQAADEAVPKFDAAYLANAANIKLGQDIWGKQCRHCHGNSAYPGKAPKLSPGGLEPEFIFERVSYGFRGMPAWNTVFTLEERKAVVAYIKSSGFSP
jgi:mono/diheme cytochrome c family protein